MEPEIQIDISDKTIVDTIEDSSIRVDKVIFLGTSSAVPAPPIRNVSGATLLLSNGRVVLCDCGEGTQHQLLRSKSLKLSKLDTIVISHLHGDHSLGLFGLLLTMGFHGRSEEVTVIGPKGIKELLHVVLLAQGGFPPYPLTVLELQGQEVDCGFVCGGLQVSAFSQPHRMPTYGFLFSEPEKPGKLDVAIAASKGAAGRQLGLLKSGQNVQLADGTVIKSADCVGPPVKGFRIAFVPDTVDSTLSPIVSGPAFKCELLIHECTYDAKSEEKAVDHQHATSMVVAACAQLIQPQLIILNHFSTRYKFEKEEKDDVSIADIVNEVAFNAKPCAVAAASDFFTVKRSKDGFSIPQKIDECYDIEAQMNVVCQLIAPVSAKF